MGSSLEAATRALRVLVVDDHPVVCDGVALLVQNDTAVEVSGSAHTALDAIDLARALAPDVILLDLRLPDMPAPELTRRLRDAAPPARIIVFTAFADYATLSTLNEAGIDGCLLKDASRTDLIDSICRVARGERVFDPRIEGGGRNRSLDAIVAISLTPREHEVLRRVAMGETNPEIATAIGLSRNTVKAYLQTVLQKLGARNRVEAIIRASELGLL
jgi:two-component system, NarL family, nitrate/nitrite response regulator NarL